MQFDIANLLTAARYAVLWAAKMSMLVFWVVTPCELVGRKQSFGETYYLHLQSTSFQIN
jgi:hypothetical protein